MMRLSGSVRLTRSSAAGRGGWGLRLELPRFRGHLTIGPVGSEKGVLDAENETAVRAGVPERGVAAVGRVGQDAGAVGERAGLCGADASELAAAGADRQDAAGGAAAGRARDR